MGLTKPRAAQIYNLDYKQSTRVVTVTNITLSGGAPSLVDGVTLSLNDRILVTGQTTGSQNGVYLVTTVGTGSNGTWARTSDTNETGELEGGTIIMVTEGTIYADTQWKLTTNDPITIGTTALTFVQNYSANSIAGGNSNVTVLTNANVLLSSAGTANVVDVFGTGIKITGTQSVTGNTTTGNLLTGGLISATGNVTGNYFLGNVACASGIFSTKIFSGTTEANIVSANGNLAVSVGGTSNVAVFATTGEYVTGLLSATGNITGGNILSNSRLSVVGNIVQSGSGSYQAWSETVGATSAGTVQANAYAITTTSTQFTTVATGSGAILPSTATVGQLAFVANDATNALLLYPPTGGVIDQATANTAISVSGLGMWMGIALTASNWTTISPDTVGTTNQITVTQGNGIVTLSLPATVTTTTLSATGNVIGGNITTVGLLTATGNITGGNILTTGLISATGNITGNYFLGNVACASGIFSTKIFSGTTEANIVSANGNLAISVGGTSNVAVYATTGEYITGLVSATGNITGGNVLTGGLISATGNATAGNLLTGGLISATANIQAGNVRTVGLVSATGNVTGNNFIGNGSALTGLNAFGTVTVSGQSNITAVGLNAPLTFAAGSNIAITTGGNTVTIAYTSTSSTSIFATGGDMGLISQPVTASEDLGNLALADTSYDLGTLFTTVTYNQIDMTGFTSNINTGNLNAVGLVSATGNITGNVHLGNTVSVTGNVTGNYILGNGSQLTGLAAANSSIAITTTTISANVTIGNGTNGFSVGPMTTANGVSVTVSAGQRWIII